MKKYDAVIIGFGKGGKTLAGFLAGKGQNVALIEKSDIIDEYFDNVIINTENSKIKNNRIALMKKIENSIEKIMII